MAQRPTACDGPEGPWPATRRPSPDFPQFFCPAVNPHASTDLHWVWACKMDNSEFEFVYHFNHLNPCICLLHVVQIRTFSFSVHSSLYRNRQRTFIIERCKLLSNHTVKTHNLEPKNQEPVSLVIHTPINKNLFSLRNLKQALIF